MQSSYQDRVEAGQKLAESLQSYAGRADVLVLALPRGGVPVAFEVAKALDAPMDLLLVRKLGTPRHEELAMGAIATGGALVLNEDVIRYRNISQQVIDSVAAKERQEMQRRQQAYRGDWPEPEVNGRCVIVVDDGLATGATMRAAVAALKQLQPAQIVVAVPVAPPDTVDVLRNQVDELVCPMVPAGFAGVGQWYLDFSQTTDGEVRELLAKAWQRDSDGTES